MKTKQAKLGLPRPLSNRMKQRAMKKRARKYVLFGAIALADGGSPCDVILPGIHWL